jgi:hypothetical protein
MVNDTHELLTIRVTGDPSSVSLSKVSNRLAQQTCEPYPHVDLQNCSFEEWTSDAGKFDAVLWNKELQPLYEVYQQLSEVYQTHAALPQPPLRRQGDASGNP